MEEEEDYGCVDWEDDDERIRPDLSISIGDAPPAPAQQLKSPKRKRTTHTKKDQVKAIKIHKKCLKIMVKEFLRCCELAKDDILLATLSSLLPAHLTSAAPTDINEEFFRSLMIWYRLCFEIAPSASVEDEDADSLMTALTERRGSPQQLTLLFYNILTLLHIPCKILCTVDPPPHQLREYNRSLRRSFEAGDAEELLQLSNQKTSLWCEVRPPSASSSTPYMNIDPIHNEFNNKSSVASRRRTPVVYVFSHSSDYSLHDETLAYATPATSNRTKALRITDIDMTWYISFLSHVSVDVNASELHHHIHALSAQLVSSSMPTSLAGFRTHPIYTLYLKHNEVSGAAPVGFYEGRPVYDRRSVTKLLTSHQWKMQRRQVRSGAKPIKTAKIRQKEINYYSKDQTDPIEVPPVTNGVIPTNAFGNIHIWGGSLDLVPNGAAYIESPYAQDAASALHVYHVVAVVGYEERMIYGSGMGELKKMPVFGGVVVLDECEELVREAVAEMERRDIEIQHDAKKKKILYRWERLTVVALQREKLRVEYGH